MGMRLPRIFCAEQRKAFFQAGAGRSSRGGQEPTSLLLLDLFAAIF
ncbi:MAG: hypothetical protein LUI14_06065 [Lachnospiraceae bacterium]|nr:hypothetical protein [Lachnospiraceae bacterium]